MKPYFSEDGITIYHGDCRAVLAALPECSVDAVVTDPPYDLTAGKKGGTGEASLNPNSPAGRSRITTGFMGKKWDGTGVAFDPETWKAVLRVMKPGAYLLAFGGTRTYHRMVCAIEDAGFEIRDQIQWLYGSGFPKSLNLGNGIGTALKPAHEPIVLARKSLIGTVAENVLEHGTGGLNVDGCRINPGEIISGGGNGCATIPNGFGSGETKGEGSRPRVEPHDLGRWPANIIHDGSDEVLAAFPDAPGQQRYVGPEHGKRPSRGIYGDFGARPSNEPRNDSGSAARFFYCAKASVADREEGLKSLVPRQRDDSRKEGNPGGDNPRNRGLSLRKNHHPTVKPTELMRYLVRLVTPSGGVVLDCFCGSGSTGKAAALEGFKAILIDAEEVYCELASLRARLKQPSLL